jgi:hypothetical protein
MSGNNAVRGPSSALSSFLRENGIAAPPRNVFARAAPQNMENHEGTEIIQLETVLPESSVGAERQLIHKRKRTVKKKLDEDVEDDLLVKKKSRPVPKCDPKDLTNVRFCERCQRRYMHWQLSPLCNACLIISTGSKPSKATKHVVKKREINAYQMTGQSRVIVLPLRDLCIKVCFQYLFSS